MKDIIQDRINKITDLKERKVLKNILITMYEEIMDYNLEMYNKLEKRVYDEIDDSMEKFYIFTSLDNVKNVDPISDFFHPMVPSDLDNIIFDMKELAEKISLNEDIILTSVFMECDNLKFNEIISSSRRFKGFVKTDSDIYEVSVRVEMCRKYIDAIKNLYHIFQINGIEWHTVNCPYAYKYIDIILDSGLNIENDEKVIEISIDLGEYEKYKRTDLIPLWNIDTVKAEDKTFPMPAKDRINFDHTISLIDLGVQNGYMATENNDSFYYIKRYENDIVIISSSGEQYTWELLKIESDTNHYRKNYSYEILSNKRELGFVGRYSSLKSIKIRTKAEMDKLFKSYYLSNELNFYDIQVIEKYDRNIGTADYNTFLDDNIRVNRFKKVMLIKFVPRNRDDFLIYDKLSFLISEAQILFPEFKCIGELV